VTLRGKDIRCVGGECYAHVFENPRMGVERGLFWNFILECAPITWNGELWKTSLLCDWVTLPIRTWPGMTAVTLGEIPRRDLLEASFYLSAHHDLRLNRFEVAHERKDLFRVHVGGEVDLRGYDDLDGIGIPIDTSGSVRFKGLIVAADNLFPKPQNEADAIAVAREFLDLENFAEPARDGRRYLFEPRLDVA
jgi:hypothetical protein